MLRGVFMTLQQHRVLHAPLIEYSRAFGVENANVSTRTYVDSTIYVVTQTTWCILCPVTGIHVGS